VLGGVPVSRLDPGRPELADLIVVAATEINTDADRAPMRRPEGGALMHERPGPPDPPAPPRAPGADRTFTGNRGLQIEEPLIFEIGRTDDHRRRPPRAGPVRGPRLGGSHARTAPIGLPGLSEPEAMRHYVRLSQKNYAIDAGSIRSARAR
jgi:hypothetical protein